MTPDPAWQRYWRYLTARFRRDVDEELEFHIAMRARELEEQGLSADQARREAERRFGDRRLVQTRLERIERKRGLRMTVSFFVQELLQDVRYGVRSLLKRPGFALMTASSLALGIAATTVVLSLIDSWLLRPLPGRNGSELVVIGATSQASGSMILSQVSLPTARDVALRTDLFQDVAAVRMEVVALRRAGSDRGERQILLAATGNYFSVLGISAAVGRLFTPDDDRQQDRVMVLSYRTWTERFGGDPAVVGAQVYVNTVPFVVIGVAQAGFQGTEHIFAADGFVPARSAGAFDPAAVGLDQRRNDGWFKLMALPRPGTSLAQIRQGLDLVSRQLDAAYPELGEGYHLAAVPETRARPSLEASGGATAGGIVFLGLAVLVLLTAVVNATNLILARATTRRTEMAVRQALGASRGRVVQQLVTETLMLSLLALAGGWLLARLAIAGITSIPVNVAGLAFNWGIVMDARVFGMAVAITLAAGLLAGLGPAFSASRFRLQQQLREGGRAGTGRGGRRVRSALVVAQVAASAVVLVAAGLLAASVRQAARIDLSFVPDQVLTLAVDATLAHYDEPTARPAFDKVAAAVRQVPGVQVVAWTGSVPIEHGSDGLREVRTAGTSQTTKQGSLGVLSASVDPAFFEVLRMPVIEGRAFTRADDSTAPRVAIVNQRAAELLWPGRSAVGQTFRMALDGPPIEVVGVTRTSRYLLIGEGPRPFLYLPLAQQYVPQVFLTVRTAGDPARLIEPVRAAMASADRDLVPFSANTMTDVIEKGPNGLLPLRIGAAAATAIGAVAIALTLMGLYGIIAYSVTERTREIGLRMALGASRWTVIRSVLGQGGRLAAIGIGLGILGALVVSRALAGLLVGVGTRDRVVFVAVAVGLALATLGSAYLPARRASQDRPGQGDQGGLSPSAEAAGLLPGQGDGGVHPPSPGRRGSRSPGAPLPRASP